MQRGSIGDDASRSAVHAGLVKRQPIEIRLPSQHDEHPVGCHLAGITVSLLKGQHHFSVTVTRARCPGSGHQSNTVACQSLRQVIDQLTVRAWQKSLAHFNHGRFHPESSECRSILQSIHASTENDQRFREVFQFVQRLVCEVINVAHSRNRGNKGGGFPRQR